MKWSEIIMSALSVSVSQGRVAIHHDARDYIPENANKKLMHNNVYLKTCKNTREEFNTLFAEPVDAYNSTQTRKDRQITDYYEKVITTEGKNKLKPVYEYVFQYGDMKNNNVRDEAFNKVNADTKNMLYDFANTFQERYPNFKIITSTIHMDEQTPHLHVAFIPVAHGYKNGMQERCSLTKALDNMGYERNNKQYSVVTWQNDCKDVMTDIMHSYGYERDIKHNTAKHKPVDEFKLQQRCNDLEQKYDALTEDYDELTDDVEFRRKQRHELITDNHKILIKNEESAEKLAQLQQNVAKLQQQQTLLKQRYDALIQLDKDMLEREKLLQDAEERQKLKKMRRLAVDNFKNSTSTSVKSNELSK